MRRRHCHRPGATTAPLHQRRRRRVQRRRRGRDGFFCRGGGRLQRQWVRRAPRRPRAAGPGARGGRPPLVRAPRALPPALVGLSQRSERQRLSLRRRRGRVDVRHGRRARLGDGGCGHDARGHCRQRAHRTPAAPTSWTGAFSCLSLLCGPRAHRWSLPRTQSTDPVAPVASTSAQPLAPPPGVTRERASLLVPEISRRYRGVLADLYATLPSQAKMDWLVSFHFSSLSWFWVGASRSRSTGSVGSHAYRYCLWTEQRITPLPSSPSTTLSATCCRRASSSRSTRCGSRSSSSPSHTPPTRSTTLRPARTSPPTS